MVNFTLAEIADAVERVSLPDVHAEHLAEMLGLMARSKAQPDGGLSREHAELMLLAAADLESWMKSYHRDGATEATVKRLRDAALGVKAAAIGCNYGERCAYPRCVDAGCDPTVASGVRVPDGSQQ